MSIHYQEKERIFTLETQNTVYQMAVTPFGILVHNYYGAKTDLADMGYLHRYYDRGFSGNPYEYRMEREISLDTIFQEYTSCGVGDYRIASVNVVNGDGSQCADFRYTSYEILPGKYSVPGMPAVYGNDSDCKTLAVTLKDNVTGLTVRLYYGVFEKKDIITRCAVLENTGDSSITLNRAFSACLDIPGKHWDVIHFYGRHCLERQVERTQIPSCIQTISSGRGTTSHHHNNFVILCENTATEECGDCYGIMLMYSGNHKTEIELDQMENVRIVTGINDWQFSWPLAPGEVFQTPEVLLSFSGKGLSKLSQNYHDIIRENVLPRQWKGVHRPVLLNSWEASYYDFNADSILKLAENSAKLGVELLVMDDGWFGARKDDNSSLGDWFVNEEKLPAVLSPLIEKINAMGLKFGIWIEPEMISENSELFRKHPDWALRVPGRKPTMARNQLVLDMTKDDVRNYLFETFDRLLTENHIDYVKWDMNRNLSDVYSNRTSEQGTVAHKYMLGVYDLMDRLTKAHPNVLLENCSGGGGRFDVAMMAFSPQIWCSDDTDALERIRILYGTSFGYPIITIGSHVSAAPNHQTGRTIPLHTRSVVAMSGAFGYELDPGKLTEAERDEISNQIRDFKKYEAIIRDGDYYRLTDAMSGNDYDAWQFVSKDRTESLLNLVVTRVRPNSPLICLRLRGLDVGAAYKIDGRVLTGKALMQAGYIFPLVMGDYPAIQLYLKKVEA